MRERQRETGEDYPTWLVINNSNRIPSIHDYYRYGYDAHTCQKTTTQLLLIQHRDPNKME